MTALIAVVLLVTSTAIARFRLPPIVRGTVWAEDGRIFLGERYQSGVARSLFEVYEGYLQFVPRILTDIATTIAPLSRYATTVTALVCLVSGIIAVLVFLLTRDVVESVAARIVLALITVLAPTLPFEVLGNMANIHWLFLWLTPWLLFFRPSRWWQSGVLAALMLASVLTEIQVAVFLPLIFFSLRRPKSWPISAAFVAGTAAQVFVTLTSPRSPSADTSLVPLDYVKGYLADVVVGMWNPSTGSIGHFLTTSGFRLGALLTLPFIAALVFLAVRSRGRRLLVPAALAAGATVPWLAALYVNRQPEFRFNEFTLGQLSSPPLLRYAVAPSMFLLALVVLAADRLLRERPSAVRIAGAVVLVAVLALQVTQFHIPATRRDAGPVWSAEFIQAEKACSAGAPSVSIATAPSWDVTLPCAVILKP